MICSTSSSCNRLYLVYDEGVSTMKTLIVVTNAVTILRIICALIIGISIPGHHWLIILISASAAFVSDYFDGILARRWGTTTRFGAFMDPLADKIVSLTILWLFVWHFTSLWYAVTAITISLYDLSTVTLRITRFSKKAIKTTHIAKLKTALLMLGMLLVLFSMNNVRLPVINAAGVFILAVASACAVLSLAYYVRATCGWSKTIIEQPTLVASIDFQQWHQEGIDWILFDVEGTLTEWGGQDVSIDVMEALKKAKKEGIHHFGLVSNMKQSHEARIKKVAAQIGARAYQIPGHARTRKPSPSMIQAILREYTIDPAQVAFVGDKVVDVWSAQRAGVARVAWVHVLDGTDHPFDKILYRRIEPILRWLIA